MKYQEMSDRSIDLAVFQAIFGKDVFTKDADLRRKWERGISYCNSWADAGPIAQENKISVLFDEQGMCHATHEACWVDGVEWQIDGVVDENPCRAICIAFLMIKGGE